MEVQTQSGYRFLIDNEDLPLFLSKTWVAHNCEGKLYLSCLVDGKRLYFHREIMKPLDGQVVDHEDRNTRNNQKQNLRCVTNGHNNHNMVFKPSNSGYRGVHQVNRPKPYKAKINIGGRQIHLGSFNTPEEAAKAYDKAAFNHYGLTTTLNFPQDYENCI